MIEPKSNHKIKKLQKSICALLLLFPLLAFSQVWQSNWEQSKSLSEGADKKLVLVFSGSDWCIPCIRLEKEIWENKTFINYASDHLILYRADFPKRKKNQLPEDLQQQHNRLAEAYNPNGYFPYVIVFSSELKILDAFAYEKKEVDYYINRIDAL